jgi:hypothetical protein
MFYCDECAIKRNWNMTAFKSFGPCEICGIRSECSDLPSSKLQGGPMRAAEHVDKAQSRFHNDSSINR